MQYRLQFLVLIWQAVDEEGGAEELDGGMPGGTDGDALVPQSAWLNRSNFDPPLTWLNLLLLHAYHTAPE